MNRNPGGGAWGAAGVWQAGFEYSLRAYYAPLPNRLAALRDLSEPQDEALAHAVDGLTAEMQVFAESFGSYTSGFFIARRSPWD